MGIPVAGLTAVEALRRERTRQGFAVAGHAGHRSVAPPQRIPSAVVIEAGRLGPVPSVGRVAVGAGAFEAPLVRVLVAIGAGFSGQATVLHVAPGPGLVAVAAADVAVEPGERKPGLLMIESFSPSPLLQTMTGRAGCRLELAGVRIGVAGGALTA